MKILFCHSAKFSFQERKKLYFFLQLSLKCSSISTNYVLMHSIKLLFPAFSEMDEDNDGQITQKEFIEVKFFTFIIL
jgi:hypothetical protein